MMCSGRTGSLIRQGANYEIKDCCNRECARPRIEAWTPGLGWPAVCAAEHGGEWIVLVDPVIAEVADLGAVRLTALGAINAEHALDWVELLAALYVKAVAK
jgi:hypothetical protein